MSGENLTIRQDGIYEIGGLLTFATVPALIGQSADWLQAGNSSVVVDLKHITKADSAGLALMVEWLHLARKSNRQLTFVNIPDQLANLIRISGLEHVFPLNNLDN